MTSIVEITTTLETREQAETLAEQFIEQRLAACVQIDGPLRSVYRWQGEIQHAEEYRCTIKTLENRLPQAIECLKKYHPYDLPEVLVHPGSASKEYYQWLSEQVDDDN